MHRLLLVALVVAGCSGASATISPSPTAQLPATPTAQPSVSASASPDIAALASKYLEIVGVANPKIDACNSGVQAGENSSDLAAVKASLQICIDAFAGMTDSLAAVNWGPVQPKVDNVIAAIAKTKAVVNDMTSSASIAEVKSHSSALVSADGDLAAAVAVLRVALGLPQAPQPTPRPALQFSPATLPDAQVGSSYAATITVSQAVTPVGGASVQHGALPAGLDLALAKELDNTIQISGTPTVAGTFSFTIYVWCYGTNVNGQTATQGYTLVVK